MRPALALALLLAAGLGSSGPEAGAAVPAAAALRVAGHKHRWVKTPRKEWVPPVYRKVVVGHDQKGRPIYKKVLVKPGYWRTVYVLRCAVCGRIRR